MKIGTKHNELPKEAQSIKKGSHAKTPPKKSDPLSPRYFDAGGRFRHKKANQEPINASKNHNIIGWQEKKARNM
jgi:hypothetical protein